MTIAFAPFAHEPDEARDDDDEHGEDRGLDFLDETYRALRDGDEPSIHFVQYLARCFQEMASAAAAGNKRALKHWYQLGRKLVDEETDHG
jgi:hypothetical protein